MGRAGIHISADAVGWYESGSVKDVTIRNNVFDGPTSNYCAIWIESFSTEVVPGRTVHQNVKIDANRFSLEPSGQLVNGKSVSDLSFTNTVVDHFAPTTPVHPKSVSSKPMFDFTGITISGNPYAPGFSLRANTASNVAANMLVEKAPSVGDAEIMVKVSGATMSQHEDSGVMFHGDDDNYVVLRCKQAGLLTGGLSDADTPLIYSSMKVNGAAQPIFASIVTPGPLEYAAGLADPVWSGIDFGAAKSPLAWLKYTDSSVASISTTFAPKTAGIKVQVIFNDATAKAKANGSHTFKLLAGPTVKEVNTIGADGVATQAYRRVVVSELPTKIPGTLVNGEAVVDPTPSSSPSASASPSATARPSSSPSATPSRTTGGTPSTEPSATPSAIPSNTVSGSVSSETVAPGGNLSITGKNFKPGTKATFTLYSEPVLLSTAMVAAVGTATLTVELPANLPAGRNAVVIASTRAVVIAGTRAEGRPVEFSIALAVTGAGGSQPATTGAATMAATAAPLLVRRRRSHG